MLRAIIPTSKEWRHTCFRLTRKQKSLLRVWKSTLAQLLYENRAALLGFEMLVGLEAAEAADAINITFSQTLVSKMTVCCVLLSAHQSVTKWWHEICRELTPPPHLQKTKGCLLNTEHIRYSGTMWSILHFPLNANQLFRSEEMSNSILAVSDEQAAGYSPHSREKSKNCCFIVSYIILGQHTLHPHTPLYVWTLQGQRRPSVIDSWLGSGGAAAAAEGFWGQTEPQRDI